MRKAKTQKTKPKMKINKDSKGITLIALVITIIILLILAGITIKATSGEKGIIGEANSAKNAAEISDFIESVQIELIRAQAESKNIDDANALMNTVAPKLQADGYSIQKVQVGSNFKGWQLENTNITINVGSSNRLQVIPITEKIYKYYYCKDNKYYEILTEDNVTLGNAQSQLPEPQGGETLNWEDYYKDNVIITYTSEDISIATFADFTVTGRKAGTTNVSANCTIKENDEVFTLTATVQVN